MNLKLIKSEAAYLTALNRLDLLFDANDGTKESDEAEILMLLIEDYESQYYPIAAPDPISAIKIRMEELDLKPKDLVGVIGQKSRVSEILNKKKKLTVDMIRRLEEALKIPASLLVTNYNLE